MSEVTREDSGKSVDEELESIVVANHPILIMKPDEGVIEKAETGKADQLHVEIEILEEGENRRNTKELQRIDESVPQILTSKPLCADYDSSSDTDSDSESTSESDSSSVDSDSDSSSLASSDDLREICDELEGRNKSEKKDGNIDLDLFDLPPIENLRISVPQEECQEIGTISSIVDSLVVVQGYKDTPALDLDTVLFLDAGKKSLGRIFDVLGPVHEPVYAVRFNNVEEIADNNIEKGQKVYYAPKTEYTSFVFVSELMKMKGSDASWKNNEEAPPECQDFSDDEEEHRHKHGEKRLASARQPDNPQNGHRKKGKIHSRHPGRAANYRNPFALGHPRNQRFYQPSPNFRYPYQNPQQPIYPDESNSTQLYNKYHHGGVMLRPGFPMHSAYHYPSQQNSSYPIQQFAMPPVPIPPPPPPPPVQQPRNNPPRLETKLQVFGCGEENPSEDG